MKNELIARVAHEINRAYCASLGDNSQPEWESAPEWQRASALAGVQMHLQNPDATPEQSHESWFADKLAHGWKYGPVKDAEKKEHPCCVPYAELPPEQKAKDYLFRATVHALKNIPDADDAVAAATIAAVRATQPAQATPDAVAVHYIGRRPRWHDTIYRTGLYFDAGQVRAVPLEIARKLLRHQDLFAELQQTDDDPPRYDQHYLDDVEREDDDTAELLEKGKDKADKVEQSLTEIQALYDQIDRMDKPGLLHFAKTQYKQDLDARRSVASLRAETKSMIDRFGVV
jgi:hypothetical protein